MSAAGALLLAVTAGHVPVAVLCAADGTPTGLNTLHRQVAWADRSSAGPAIRRALSDPAARIVLTNAASTPYRCLGGIIYLSQQQGYRQIGFIAEPPPFRRWQPARRAGTRLS